MSNNNASGALTNTIIANQALVTLGAALAPLSWLSKDFSADVVRKNSTVSVPLLSSVGSVIASPTQWNVSGIEREVRSVSLVHYARPFAITSAELNAGHKLADAAEKAAQAMAEKIITLVLAQATEANFGTSIVTTMSGNSNMTAAMLKTGWGSIPGGKKYAIVEDSAYANFLPSDLNQFDPRNGLSVYGFDGMKNVGSSVAPSKFTALFCNPAALCVATAIPDIAPEIQSLMYSYEIVTEPNTGISFAVSHWGDVQTREQYASIDLCFGVAVGDKNAGAVLYSQT